MLDPSLQEVPQSLLQKNENYTHSQSSLELAAQRPEFMDVAGGAGRCGGRMSIMFTRDRQS